MEFEMLSDKTLRNVVKILIQDGVLLSESIMFMDALKIWAGEKHMLQRRLMQGGIGSYDFFVAILQIWVSQNGPRATIAELIDILERCEFKYVTALLKENFTVKGQRPAPDDSTQQPTNLRGSLFPSINKLLSPKGIQVTERIDQGTFGDVFHATSETHLDGVNYALKQISIAKFIANTNSGRETTDYIQRLLREVKIMSKLENTTNIVRYYDSWFAGPLADLYYKQYAENAPILQHRYERDAGGSPILSEDEEKTFLFIKMELCHLNLQYWMNTNPIPSSNHTGYFDKVDKIIHQVINGVSYLHKEGIIHRDLKPNNILILRPDFVVKIADFGVSRDRTLDISLTGKIGCETFRSPEMMRGQQYDCKTDIYSLGITYLLLLHKFEDELEKTVRIPPLLLGEGGVIFSNLEESGVGAGRMDLLKAMIQVDQTKRPTANDLLLKMYV